MVVALRHGHEEAAGVRPPDVEAAEYAVDTEGSREGKRRRVRED